MSNVVSTFFCQYFNWILKSLNLPRSLNYIFSFSVPYCVYIFPFYFYTIFKGNFPFTIIMQLLSVFPVLYNTSLSLSYYTQQFVPPITEYSQFNNLLLTAFIVQRIHRFVPLCCAVLSHSVMSNSLQPCGPQPTRFFCPWNFPGSTEVGCHLHLQRIFPTQGSNLRLLHLVGWQAYSLPLCHLGVLVIFLATS